VAELPLGQDPADLILADQSQFKKVVGQSVPVIEFLLHVLRRETSDDRAFKLKVRNEVLPFILLLPNRIDQEHFLNKVALAINTSEDAVRYELQRLREKAETDEPTSKSKLVESAKRNDNFSESTNGEQQAERTHLFLQASCEVVPADASLKIKTTLNNLQKIFELPVVSQSELAGTIFSLEQQFAKLPEQVIKDEVVAKLNQLKLILIRRCWFELKQNLQSLEATGDSVGALQALDKIKEYETQRREPLYEISDIFA
jgi:hypothetical protein